MSQTLSQDVWAHLAHVVWSRLLCFTIIPLMTRGTDEQNIVVFEAPIFWVAQALTIGASADHTRTAVAVAPYHQMPPVPTHEAILE